MLARRLLDAVFPPQCGGCNILGTGLCDGCARTEPIDVALPTLRVRAFGAYEGTIRSAVLAVKHGRRDVAEALGRRVAVLLGPQAVVVPVPTTAGRRRVRGIDGVALLASAAAADARAVCCRALAHRGDDAQRGRSRGERLAARGRFFCDPSAVGGRRVTLFDDVCTTGATLRDCADAVREAGGVVEDAVVVAVTKSRESWSTAAAS